MESSSTTRMARFPLPNRHSLSLASSRPRHPTGNYTSLLSTAIQKQHSRPPNLRLPTLILDVLITLNKTSTAVFKPSSQPPNFNFHFATQITESTSNPAPTMKIAKSRSPTLLYRHRYFTTAH